MAANHLFTALMLATLITYMKCNFNFNLSFLEVPDITKFYATNATIWTAKTTASTNITCKVDLVNETTANYTDFERRYYWNGTTVSNYLEGNFTKMEFLSNKSTFDGMLVGPKGVLYTTREQLRSVDEGYQCGVFSVSLMHGDPWYELRVMNATVEHIPVQCENFTKQFVQRPKQWTSLYNSTCQKILKNKKP